MLLKNNGLSLFLRKLYDMNTKRILHWLLPVVITLFITSCSQDNSDDLIGFEDDTARTEHLEFEANLNGKAFKADRITFVKEGSVVHFVAKKTSADETIFLTLDTDSGNVLQLGTTVDNPKNNVAGFLIQSEGYVTSNVNAPTGEISLSVNNLKDELFEGTFFFTASDENDNYIYVTGGRFSKK